MITHPPDRPRDAADTVLLCLDPGCGVCWLWPRVGETRADWLARLSAWPDPRRAPFPSTARSRAGSGTPGAEDITDALRGRPADRQPRARRRRGGRSW